MNTFSARVSACIIGIGGMVGMLSTALANPVPLELDAEIVFDADSNRVVFSYLAIEYSDWKLDPNETDPEPGQFPTIKTADVLVDGEWIPIDSRWEEFDRVYFINGLSHPFDIYNRFTIIWPCPQSGEFNTRITKYSFVDDDELEDGEEPYLVPSAFAERTVTCTGAGDVNDTSLDSFDLKTYPDVDTEIPDQQISEDTEDSEDLDSDTDLPTGDDGNSDDNGDDGDDDNNDDNHDDDNDDDDVQDEAGDDSHCAFHAMHSPALGATNIWRLLSVLFQ